MRITMKIKKRENKNVQVQNNQSANIKLFSDNRGYRRTLHDRPMNNFVTLQGTV